MEATQNQSNQSNKSNQSKIKKPMNTALKSTISLGCIVIVCISILFFANKFLSLTDEQRLGKALNHLISNDGATIFYNENHDILQDFNSNVPTRERIDGEIIRVYKLMEGKNENKLVIEAQGEGYKGNSTTLIAFNLNGTIYGVAVKQYGSAENLAYRINQKLLSEIAVTASLANLENEMLAKKLELDEFDKVASATGAPITVGGILNAINIASLFYKEVILQIPPKVYAQIEIEKDEIMLQNLNDLMQIDGKSALIYYRIADVKTDLISLANLGVAHELNKGQIECGYVTDTGEFILKIYGEGFTSKNDTSNYGKWEILALINQNNLIQAVKIISNSARPVGGNFGYLAELINDLYLTEQFKNKNAEYFLDNNELPFGGGETVTHATQTNNGIKICGYLAVTKAQQMRYILNQTISSNGLPTEVENE